MDPQNPPAAQGGDAAVTAANNTNSLLSAPAATNGAVTSNVTGASSSDSNSADILAQLNALAPGGGIAQTQAQNQAQNQVQSQVQNQEQGQGQMQGQPVVQTQPVDESDPLRKLMSMVKGSDGAVDELKVKQLFVNVGNKLSNKSLRYIVEQYQKQNLPAEAIVTLLLDLDEKVEMGEYNEELFQKLNETNEW